MAVEHTFRYLKNTQEGVVEKIETKKLTAKQSIKFHCLDCSGGLIKDVHECGIKLCPLWSHRPLSRAGSKKLS